MAAEHEVDVNGWHCTFISNLCVSIFSMLNMCSYLFSSPIDMCAVIIHECPLRVVQILCV